jgi:curved DNA-binding protein
MSVEFKDYYTILGVPRDVSPEDLKKAFRKLAREYHPDVAKDKKTAEEKFKSINEANEVLSDPVKRKKYDDLGANWRQSEAANASSDPTGKPRRSRGSQGQEFHFGGTGFSDFFEQFFGGGQRYGAAADGTEFAFHPGQTRTSGPHRGADVEGDILVTLEEAMHGAVRPITLESVHPQTGEATTHSFKVRIPPGATDGKRIRIPGQGEHGAHGGDAGDLYLNVRHAAHPEFTSRGADLYHELEVAPWEAVLGAEISVPTLDGSVKLRLASPTENGQKLRVRGRGLPIGKTGERGDLFVQIQVQLPTQTTPEERALWEKLRATSTFNPRSPRSA